VGGSCLGGSTTAGNGSVIETEPTLPPPNPNDANRPVDAHLLDGNTSGRVMDVTVAQTEEETAPRRSIWID